MQGVGLTPQLLSQAFPFHIAFTADGRVSQAGSVLTRMFPQLEGGNIRDTFVIDRPQRMELEMELIRYHPRTVFVLQAVNGVEALDIVRNAATRIDIVITDVWMPGMSGEAFAREFRHERPNTPIVFISGQEPDGSVESILENGEAVFLSKPFSRDALEMVILSACERVRSQG